MAPKELDPSNIPPPVDDHEDEADPIYPIALSLSISPKKNFTIVPVTLPPQSSQFQTLPPSTVLFPFNQSTATFLSALRSEVAQLMSSREKGVDVQLTTVGLVDLERVVVEVSPRAWRGEITEKLVRKGLENARIVHTGDKLLGGVAGEVRLCEPVGQGRLVGSTKVVVLKGEGQVNGAADVEDEDEEEELGVTSFFNLPPRPGMSNMSTPAMSLGVPAVGKAGYLSPGQDGEGRKFKACALASKIEPELLFPHPKEGEDEEARVYVEVSELVKLGKFSGDWVGIGPVVESEAFGDRLRAGIRRGLNGIKAQGTAKTKDWRPVRIYSLPEVYAPGKKGRGQPGRVYLSPILLANILPNTTSIASQLLTIFPLPNLPVSRLSTPVSSPPAAKEVTLLRIASPASTDRALQPSLLLALKSHFEATKRLVRKGDVIAVTINEFLARSLFGEEHGGPGEDLLVDGHASGITPEAGQKTVAWFRVGNIAASTPEEPAGSTVPGAPSEKMDDPWEGVVFVDPSSTRMVQAGSEKRKVPGTLELPWKSYLGLTPPPMPSLHENTPAPLIQPTSYASPVLRKLRELIATATSPRAIHLHLPPIAILLTSTQRSIGKRTLALQAAADMGAHAFLIDAYELLADGGNGDVKTEAFLRARVDRALACGKDACVLVVTHVEAFAGAGKLAEVLREIVESFRAVIMTTSEVDKLSEDLRNVFTHELEVNAPDEKEREDLLRTIVQAHAVPPAKGVSLASVAMKTAALVAGDLDDVVSRAITISQARTKSLARTLPGITVSDLLTAGGAEIARLTAADFEAGVEAARKNFADSIGAPKIPNVKWDDVGGLANVKTAVMETIQLPLERPELFASGMKKRSGILFYGPPGTGKTLLAKAIATEFSLNFFSVKGPELLNMYIGESEANVRRVFQRARDARPCVVFFDELDSVAPKRGNQGDSGGVMDRIVSQLLAELDGMSEGKDGSAGGVFVVGATNRPDLLDPALLRPGRFDKLLYLGISDTHEKQLNILKALTRKFTLAPDCDLAAVAESLPFTYTGADLYALCSDAMLKAITRQATLVDAKVKECQRRLGREIGMAWWWDHESVPSDSEVIVRAEDFDAARRELVGSVSEKELEHYERVRREFETVDKDEGKGKGKGKEVMVDGHYDSGNLKGKGKAPMMGELYPVQEAVAPVPNHSFEKAEEDEGLYD